MAGTRQDLAKLPAGWNPTVLWYAKAIVELDKLAIDKRTSWRFMGAMHGFDPAGWRAKGLIRAGERPPAELTDNNTFGNQCQHGSWYFLPWHRGYLAAFEAIVAAKIKEMGGPADWALPYWNYLDRSNPNARRIPWAFLEATLPGGTRNPLNTPPRSGAPVLTPPDPGIPDINLDAVKELDFVVGANGSIGFGGGRSGFAQFNAFTGQLEGNPHNPVHVMVGGLGSGARAGWMSDPDYAGLDPIFWVHHCNVDRLWEAWMGAPGRTMVSEAAWRDGPANRRFMMPTPDGDSFTFTPRDTLRGGRLHPDYDDLVSGTGLPAAAPAAAATGVGMGTTRVQEVAVLGASDTSVNVGERPAAATVRLDPGPAGAAVRAMGPLDSGAEVSRLYLQLDNVTGAAPSAVIDVFVNLPQGTSPAEGSAYRAGSLYLFGLAKASAPDGDHAGNGLGFSMDITELAGQLTERREFDPQKLDVLIVPAGGSSAESPVKVGGIKVLERRVKAAR